MQIASGLRSKLSKRVSSPRVRGLPAAQEEGGYRPLHEAAAHSHLEACRALLHGGAHLNAHTEAGESALDLTKEPFRSTFIELPAEAAQVRGTDATCSSCSSAGWTGRQSNGN